LNLRLDALEARVLGCLVEKEITTPDHYPLSLNALVNACNQKSNRDPVLALDEATVQATLDGLGRRHLVLERSGFGSRVLKYRHRLCNGEHNPLQFAPRELAVLCELLLRGPQTPGELKPRVQRMAPFADAGEVEATLAGLKARADGPFVVRLERQSGARDSRWAQLFTGEPAAAAPAAPRAARAVGSPAGSPAAILGLRTAIYPAPDLAAARDWYARVLERAPYFDQPFYVGFAVGGFELGLLPDATPGTAGPQALWGVANADAALARLVSLGASLLEPVKDVGEGIRVAAVRDPFGNRLGIIENPNFDAAQVR